MFNTLKIQGDGFLVDGKIYAPAVDGNPYYEEIKAHIANGGAVEPEFTEAELLEKSQAEFRAERNALIREADIEIFKLEDNSMDSTAWRTYRQALRDSTLTWTLPTKP